jgi:gliding motility-associated-like protein
VLGVDLCLNPAVETNVVRPVVLTIEKNDNNIQLQWNKGFIAENEFYQIELSLDSKPFTVLETNYTQNTKAFNLDNLGTGGEEQFCFKVTASTQPGYTAGSNTACTDRIPEVDIPNAFTPNGDGLNDYIKPTIKNADIVSYQFIVYDKFGSKVFETNRPEKKWDGKINGRNIAEGAYIFYISFKTALGKKYEKSGALNVVYP